MVPETMPKSLLVIGSGAIGIEFASFFRTLGAEVTVVELLPQILPVEDEEIAKHAHKRFEKQGMKILTEAKVTAVKKNSGNVTATIEDKAGKKSEITVRSEEHTSELQSLMRISYAVFGLKKKKQIPRNTHRKNQDRYLTN